MSTRHSVLQALVELRGANVEHIEHHLACKGLDIADSAIRVCLHKLHKEGLVRKEKLPCNCCRSNLTLYYATDEGRVLTA